MQEVKRELRLLVLLLIIIVISFVWYLFAGAPRQNISPSKSQSGGLVIPPPFTPEIAAQLEKSHGFQMLVSYTDRGFEPTQASIKTGQTVRFTNNSSRTLWIAAAPTAGTKIYPGSSDCGASALDTCKALKPLEFWEFTFSESGTWGYQNNLNKADSATIRVK